MLTACERYCAFDHCRVALPWFIWTRRSDPASALRLRILEIEHRTSFDQIGWGARLIAAVLHLTRVQRELLIC